MAPSPPRRSSRARGNTITQSQPSSSSTSSISGRTERNTRSLHKNNSSKSTPAGSLSSEPLEDLEETVLTRRRTRGQEEMREKIIKVDPYEMINDGDEMQEDDESVRCVCGFEEYPGPPPFDEDTKHGKHNPEADFFASIELSDEVSGLFVQCDICKVWQHGACVGIFTEESSPDEYFCEKCRKDLHKIHTANNGQRYSNYLPLGRPSRTTSRATSKDSARSPKESTNKNGGRASSTTQSSKRRSTMNSRDAAYDEDEQLRRAIEASKEDAPHEQPDTASRRPKRGRSDSAENQSNLKRQRTSSSASPPPEKTAAVEDGSEEEEVGRNGTGSKKSRNGRNQKEKAEREDRERQRTENTTKKKGRADRKQAEVVADSAPVKDTKKTQLGPGSDASEEVPMAPSRPATKVSAEPPQSTPASAPAVAEDDPPATATAPSPQVPPSPAPAPRPAPAPTPAAAPAPASASASAPPAPPPPAPPADPVPSPVPTPDPAPTVQTNTASTHKKSTRNQKRGKGRNQYTRDREDADHQSPARSMSRDMTRPADDHPPGGSSKASTSENTRHGGRGRAAAHSKMSMNDMKRRVAAFLDFISKTQIEMAGESTSGSRGTPSSSGQPSPRDPEPSGPSINTNANTNMNGKPDDGVKDPVNGVSAGEAPAKETEFQDLNCVEMMDALTRDLLKWQKHYAS
ncbi:hypothetical protein ACRALDRAFT_2025529 [Sodiomyces alcalophilus JCM 7366]|uniref:uncharacterized protein n=1 Tax=Sodiomyces alcalophilus JCM 7366 TaxID=591952 RepID=UPI0039B4AE8F